MNIEETINGDIKTAMLAKDAKKLEALRTIKSIIFIRESRLHPESGSFV